MIDRRLTAHLEASGIRFCLVGGVALAAHGFARYTADVDLLTMDARVLAPELWAAIPAVEIRSGDPDDPLAGLVRWPTEPRHDLLVGRGYAMRLAVDTALRSSVLGVPVATPLALTLLKLEAGGPQDRNDILALVDAQRSLGVAAWVEEIAGHVPRLSAHAQACWKRVAADLGIDAG